MQRRFLSISLLALSAACFAGCAQDVGDIDRTQPNRLEKKALDGEWYMRQTVVGVPGTASTSFVGLEGNNERVRFNVQESMLFVHRVHEDVLGIDTSVAPVPDLGPSQDHYDVDVNGYAGAARNGLGAPVAAYPIQGHFDIQRQYNPTTGEPSNVLVENGTDRYWNERDYIRVDWTRNSVNTAFDPMVEISSQSMAGYWQNGDQLDASNPLHVECKNAEGEWTDCSMDDLGRSDEVAYMEVTNSYIVEPNWVDCFLTFGLLNTFRGGDCGPETITVRTSFLKVDEEEVATYEPRHYNDNEMDWFGFFRTERCTYDRLYGCRDQSTVQMINRHQIWDDWRNEDGSRMPFSQRTERPIVYYINDPYPTDLVDESVLIAHQYDTVFREVVANAKGVNMADVGQMFYLCVNNAAQLERFRAEAQPWMLESALPNDLQFSDNAPTTHDEFFALLEKGYEDGVCDRRDRAKRIGDVRYSFLAWIDNPQQNGPLGYGPSTTDPLTGETITGDAYMYGGALDTLVQQVVDLVDMTNNDLDPEAFGYGEPIEQYLADIQDRFGIPVSHGDALNKERARRAELRGKLDAALSRRQHPDFLDRASLHHSELINHNDRHRAIWERMRGTPLESMMLTPEIKVGLGLGLYGPDDEVTEEMVEDIDPVTMMRPPANDPASSLGGADMTSYWDRFNRFASRNMYMPEFFDAQLVGLAQDLKDRYADITDPTERRLRMFYDLRGHIYRSVAEHEVGHTVGLRHNFEGSFDAMNFHPEYWKIRFSSDAILSEEMRTDLEARLGNGSITQEQYDRELAQLQNMHHDPLRGVTELDRLGRTFEYQYSTTMEYGARLTSQIHGIGLYDKAALGYGYGDLVHVFEPGAEPHMFEVEFEQLSDGRPYFDIEGTSPADFIARSDQRVSSWANIETSRVIDTQDNNAVVTEDEVEMRGRFRNNPFDFWHWGVLPVMFSDDYATPAQGNMDQMYQRRFVTLEDFEGGDYLRVPYRFCSDEYRGRTPYCDVWDAGIDFNEIIHNRTRDYSSYYFINAYRRGRPSWGLWVWPYLSRLYYRYFLPVAGMYQQWLLRSSQWGLAYQLHPYAAGVQDVGIQDGLRTLMNVLSAPHPGIYGFHAAANEYKHITSEFELNEVEGGFNCENAPSHIDCTEFVRIGANGEEIYEPPTEFLTLLPGLDVKWRIGQFDFDAGFYYYLRYQVLSSNWDRLAALWAITNPEVDIIGVDTSSNIDGYLIPYFLQFDYELSRFMGGMMTENFANFAPVVSIADMNKSDYSFEFQDPIPELQTDLLPYRDPTRYRLVNPYPENHGYRSFNDRFYTMGYALAFFQVLYDQSFNQSANIFVYGSGQAFELYDTDGDGWTDAQEGRFDRDGDGVLDYEDVETPQDLADAGQPLDLITIETEVFIDPFNYKTYVAVLYRDFDSFKGINRFPISLELLRKANRAKDRWQVSGDYGDKFDLLNAREDIDLVMLTNQTFADINVPWWLPYFGP